MVTNARHKHNITLYVCKQWCLPNSSLVRQVMLFFSPFFFFCLWLGFLGFFFPFSIELQKSLSVIQLYQPQFAKSLITVYDDKENTCPNNSIRFIKPVLFPAPAASVASASLSCRVVSSGLSVGLPYMAGRTHGPPTSQPVLAESHLLMH